MYLDFVFVDHCNQPWRVATWVNLHPSTEGPKAKEIWLLYWHCDKRWVTAKRVSEKWAVEIQTYADLLPQWQADLYNELSERGRHAEGTSEAKNDSAPSST